MYQTSIAITLLFNDVLGLFERHPFSFNIQIQFMVNDSLNCIEQWLAAKAARILNESLNSGATEEQLITLETAIVKPLPEDYKALYRRHNGLNNESNMGNFFYGMSFLPLAEVLAEYQARRQEKVFAPLAKAATAVTPQNLLNPHWLALGFDGSHTWLRVDLAPTEAGTYGQVIFVDEEYETAFIIADSVAGLLSTFAQDLLQGLYQLNPDATENGEDFLEVDASIDLVNWYNAERWQHAAEE
jgi:cell wall assembly regulator SMI1